MANLPGISIVTATLNRVNYLEAAMRSVLAQDYPDIDYVVVDGGSTDGSVEVIRRHADRLSWWTSEKDNGHADALNKGFAHTRGEIMAWLNSDDQYTPWAFPIVGEIFAKFPQVQWITTLFQLLWDSRGLATHCKHVEGFSRAGFLRGENLPAPGALYTGWIQQESTFWRRSLWEQAGAAVHGLGRMTDDFELWARFYQHADLYGVMTPLGGFRRHGEQFSSQQSQRIYQAGLDTLRRFGGRPHGRLMTRVAKSGLGRRLPQRVRGWMGVHHPAPVIFHAGDGAGWTIKTQG